MRSSGNNDNSVILFGRHAGISSLLQCLGRLSQPCNSALASLGRYWRDSRPRHCSRADIPAWRPQKSHYCIISLSTFWTIMKACIFLCYLFQLSICLVASIDIWIIYMGNNCLRPAYWQLASDCWQANKQCPFLDNWLQGYPYISVDNKQDI